MALPMKVDHLQVTVKDVNKVEAFYDGLMEALGFDLNKKSMFIWKSWICRSLNISTVPMILVFVQH